MDADVLDKTTEYTCINAGLRKIEGEREFVCERYIYLKVINNS